MKKTKLTISNLKVSISGKEIIKDVSLTISAGELQAIMGPNGSGKSTLAQALMGNPNYQVKSQKSHQRRGSPKTAKVKINGRNILDFTPDKRARLGLFLAFQQPIAIPGVSVGNFLKTAYQVVHEKKQKSRKAKHNPALSVWDFNKKLVELGNFLGIPSEFLKRSVNDDFSAGEKKKIEILQALVLMPKFAIFDEIDTGLDIDALKIVARGIKKLKSKGTGILLITHYQRILKYLKPNKVHILIKGKIVATGNYKLAQMLEKKGYAKYAKTTN